MKRAFTTREKVLLVILAVMLLAIGYFKLVLEPINDSVASLQAQASAEQDMMVQQSAILANMNKMQQELDQIQESGEAKPLPEHDNKEQLLMELYGILGEAKEYSLNFGTMTKYNDYIMQRPLYLSFTAANYAHASNILSALHSSDNINQMSDVSFTFQKDDGVSVTLAITYFEFVK